MSELDRAELQRFEDINHELHRAEQTGLKEKIPFLGAYQENVKSHIYALQPDANALENDDERKKSGAAANVMAAAAMEQHRAEISNFAERGFQSSEQFLDFSDKFKDEKFMATLDALPEEDKKKLADKMAEQYNAMSPEERRKTAPEAVNWIQERSDIKLMSNNKALDGIAADVHRLGGDEAVAQLNAVKAANSDYGKVVDRDAIAAIVNQDKFAANDTQLANKTDLVVTVHNAAEERNIANNRAELGERKEARFTSEEDMFASEPTIASAAKQLQKAGMEGETDIAASKPTEVQIAENAAKDYSKGAAV